MIEFGMVANKSTKEGGLLPLDIDIWMVANFSQHIWYMVTSSAGQPGGWKDQRLSSLIRSIDIVAHQTDTWQIVCLSFQIYHLIENIFGILSMDSRGIRVPRSIQIVLDLSFSLCWIEYYRYFVNLHCCTSEEYLQIIESVSYMVAVDIISQY